MTISDLFDVPTRRRTPETVPDKGRDTSAHDARATVPVTVSGRKEISRGGRIKATMVADFKGAWLWDMHGLTVRNLWDDRMPDVEQVPDGNRALWAAWLVYNHAALAVLVPALFVLYLAGHPARSLLTAVVAAPLLTLWING